MKKNQEKFELLKSFNLPAGQYFITGSGPLGIRNLREIGDIDIFVSQELWDVLAAKYGVIDDGQKIQVIFPGGVIAAIGENSFYNESRVNDDPTVDERLAKAEFIDGLPFESLVHFIHFKQKSGRDKDLKDIQMIKAWQELQNREKLE